MTVCIIRDQYDVASSLLSRMKSCLLKMLIINCTDNLQASEDIAVIASASTRILVTFQNKVSK